jgi:AraC family transcriptional activator of pobA
MNEIKNIQFTNKKRPELDFDLVTVQDLFSKNFEEIFQHHKIDFFHILVITSGKGKHTIDFTDFDYKKGTILTIRKDQIHRFFRNKDAKGFLLLFTEDFLTSHFGKEEVLRAFQLFNELLTTPNIDLASKDLVEFIKSIESIESEYSEHSDQFSRSIIRSELHVLLVKLFRIKSKTSNNLSKRKYFDEFLQFQKLIEDNYNSTRKVIDYAKMMSCTSKTLNNICRDIVNKTAKDVINDIVIIQIKRLLINTSFSVSEIAYKSGFEEPTNMFRYFKKLTNNSPEVFRKANS